MGKPRALVISDRCIENDFTRLVAESNRIELVTLARDGIQAMSAYRKFTPDLLFIEADSKPLHDFYILRALKPEELPPVIIASPHRKNALHAFEIRALDFLLKPVSKERLRAGIDRACVEVETAKDALSAERLKSLLGLSPLLKFRDSGERFWIKTALKIEFVEPATIHWIKASDQYVKFYCANRCYLSRVSMSDVERKLEAHSFVRIHRGAIVNLTFVHHVLIKTRKRCYAVLANGTRIKVSQHRKAPFLNALGDIKTLEETFPTPRLAG